MDVDPTTIRISKYQYDPLLLAFGGAARMIGHWLREYGYEYTEAMARDMARNAPPHYRLAYLTAFGG